MSRKCPPERHVPLAGHERADCRGVVVGTLEEMQSRKCKHGQRAEAGKRCEGGHGRVVDPDDTIGCGGDMAAHNSVDQEDKVPKTDGVRVLVPQDAKANGIIVCLVQTKQGLKLRPLAELGIV